MRSPSAILPDDPNTYRGDPSVTTFYLLMLINLLDNISRILVGRSKTFVIPACLESRLGCC